MKKHALNGELMTERDIQLYLFEHCNGAGYYMTVPNARFYLGESDILAIRPSLRVESYEIKVSRSDFRADFAKTDWHRKLGKARDDTSAVPSVPNRFYYVAPESVIPRDEVPEYAGLIEVMRPYFLRTVIQAPLLHKKKLNEKQINALIRTMAYRYWSREAHYNRKVNNEKRNIS